MLVDSIERKLLVQTAVLTPDENSLECIRELLGQPLDWDVLCTQSMVHGTAGLLYNNILLAGGGNLINEDILERLKNNYMMVVYFGLRQIAEFRPIARALDDKGIKIAVLKGAALIGNIYKGDFGLRPISDIDILVREQDWPKVYEVLRESDFRPAEKDFDDILPKLTKYDVEAHIQFLSSSRTCLEFQFDLYTLGIGMRDIGGVWDRSREIEIEGVRVLVPGDEDQLLHLIIHANRHGCARLKWLVDIAETVQRSESLNWDLFVEIAKREKVTACVYSTLEHIERLFGRGYMHQDVLERLKPKAYQRRLWRFVWPDKMLDEFRGRHEDAICFYYYRPLSGWNLINFALMNRIRDKIAYQLRWMFPSMSWMSQTYSKPKSLALIKYYPIRLMDRRLKRKEET